VCAKTALVAAQGLVSWVTQLVVHPAYRNMGVGRRLCRIAWGAGRFFAAGLVTSHPFAVKALERATERDCNRSLIEEHAADLVRHCNIPYVQGKQLCFEGGKCLVDTQFCVDHSEVEQLRARLSGWRLGPLEDGKEFLAFAFATSPRAPLA
jgi:hypothetical protein